jgi:hypothetical protein
VPEGDAKAGDSKQWHLGRGINSRHDVVFFERNGLRHGEFTLRESGKHFRNSRSNPSLRWGYRVRALAWNADSTVRGVWIEQGYEPDLGALFLTYFFFS